MADTFPGHNSPDLFGHVLPLPFGLTVQLVDSNDQHHADCGDLATIEPGKGPHAAALRCMACGKHRGWLGFKEFNFINALVARYGPPTEAIVLRNWNTIAGDKAMTTTKQYDNSGILFRNEDKNNERDRDYQGEATVAGIGYWLSAWIKEGKKGKFMTFSFKPKDAPKAAVTKTAAADFNDEVPF
jgi:hypothetical protein